MILRYYLFFIILISFRFIGVAQSNGDLLIISNTEAIVLIDGEEIGELTSGKPLKYNVSVGQHYIQVINKINKEEKNDIIEVVAEKQQVLKYDFEVKQEVSVTTKIEEITVADLKVIIPGLVTASADENFQYPTHLFAFEKGDEIILNVDMKNDKGTNFINISTYPDGNIVYSNDAFKDLKNKTFKVKERSIYRFTFGSKHTFDRNAHFLITRVPASEATKNFNTKVVWKDSYKAVTIQKPQEFYVNSGSNRVFKGGKTRIVVPVKLPANTVKWYYEFTATRDEAEVNRTMQTFNLIGQLTQIVDQTGFLKLGVDIFNTPPGSNVCDIYLIDHANYNSFLARKPFSQYTEATRLNIKSGIVETTANLDQAMYLGIKNPHYKHGIHVGLEIVAIVKQGDYVMQNKN